MNFNIYPKLKPNKQQKNGKALPLGSGTSDEPVYVVIETVKNGKGIRKNPFLIGKTIAKVGKIEELRSIRGGESYIAKCASSQQATALTKITQLVDGTTMKCSLHEHMNKSKCVVFVPEVLEVPENELQTELEGQKVCEVKRITKFNNGVTTPTPLLILTISSTTPPSCINFGGLRIGTRRYYPTPMRCQTCLKFGHTKARCKDKIRCKKCSQEHTNENCSNDSYCINCKGNHVPTSRNCPCFKRETEITKMKIDRNISFPEAKKLYNEKIRSNNSYAEVVAQSRAQPRLEKARKDVDQVDYKTLYIEQKAEMEKLRKELADLRELLLTSKGLGNKATTPTPTPSTSGLNNIQTLINPLNAVEITSTDDDTSSMEFDGVVEPPTKKTKTKRPKAKKIKA